MDEKKHVSAEEMLMGGGNHKDWPADDEKNLQTKDAIDVPAKNDCNCANCILCGYDTKAW